MLKSRLFKYLCLFLASIASFTCILYLTAIAVADFDVFNEHIFCCSLGVVFSVILILFKSRLVQKFEISNKAYFLFTLFVPAVVFDTFYILYYSLNNTVSLLDTSKSKVLFYLIFMGYTLTVASIIVVTVELIKLLKKSRSRKNNTSV